MSPARGPPGPRTWLGHVEAENAVDFVDGRPIQNRLKRMKDLPATSKESNALSKDLKQRGFKFVGSTIIYAHMQAVGMVNDHLVTCFRHKAVGRKK